MIPSFISFHLAGERLDAAERKALEGVASHRHHADSAIDAYIEAHHLDTDYQVKDEMDEAENLFGITDSALLQHTLRYFSALRAAEILWRKAEVPFGFDTLMDIHGELFGDICPSAGVLRTFPEGMYCVPNLIEPQGEEIFRNIQADGYLAGEKGALLPRYLGDLLALHPFVLGNRMAIHLIFVQMGRFCHWSVDWARLDPAMVALFEDQAVMGQGHDLFVYLAPAICSNAHAGSTR